MSDNSQSAKEEAWKRWSNDGDRRICKNTYDTTSPNGTNP